MPSKLRKKWEITLAGEITVAFRRVQKEWYATALQFDILGYGRTKDEALEMLRELIEIYMLEMAKLLSQGEKVKFFNPSNESEWNRAAETRHYHAAFVIEAEEAPRKRRVDSKNLGKLVEFIESLDKVGVELVAAD